MYKSTSSFILALMEFCKTNVKTEQDVKTVLSFLKDEATSNILTKSTVAQLATRFAANTAVLEHDPDETAVLRKQPPLSFDTVVEENPSLPYQDTEIHDTDIIGYLTDDDALPEPPGQKTIQDKPPASIGAPHLVIEPTYQAVHSALLRFFNRYHYEITPVTLYRLHTIILDNAKEKPMTLKWMEEILFYHLGKPNEIKEEKKDYSEYLFSTPEPVTLD